MFTVESRWRPLFRAIRNFTPCSHRETVVTRIINSRGVGMFKRYCLLCGGASGNWIKKKSLPFDVVKNAPIAFRNIEKDRRTEQLNSPWFENLQQKYKAFSSRVDLEKDEKWWSLYDQYLSSPEWAAKRKIIMERDHHTCRCGGSAAQVHHLIYDNVGEEESEDLVAICLKCHKTEHAR